MSSTTVPNPPTFVTASSGGTQATISWVVPIVNGGSDITSYTVTSTPIDGLTAAVTGITNINSNTINSPGNLNFLNDNPFITLKTGKQLIIKDDRDEKKLFIQINNQIYDFLTKENFFQKCYDDKGICNIEVSKQDVIDYKKQNPKCRYWYR